jgi:uncharacterized membrane protein YkoI
MKPIRTIRNTTLAIGLTVGLAGISLAAEMKGDDEKDHVVPWSEVPAAVQAAITAEAKGGKVESVERSTEKKGVTYEAKVKLADGDELEIETDANGKVLKVEREDGEDEHNDGKK